jgi:NAD(P)-dependent dehydrogenase (short-subunit alcohol dehydrogenase family)
MPDTVVITGANRGIGLSFAKLYKKFGYKVYALCREASTDLNTLGVTVIENIDVGSPDVGKKLQEELKDIDINLLINNAGILQNETLGQIDYGSIEKQFAVNAIGPLRISEALIDNLKPGKDGIARVALITSRMGSIADNTSGGRYGYRMSKAALNIAGVSLAHDLKHKQIAVGIYHPGLVATEMIGGHGDIGPDEAAERIDKRIYALSLEDSGGFWHSNGEALPW